MNRKAPESTVGIGLTDGHRYIGIAPPLTSEEIRDMERAGVLGVDIPKKIIDEFDPACTFISVGPSTERAQELAKNIAHALRQTREGHVQHNLEPVGLIGHNSTPFNPNTDALRLG